MQAMYSVHSKTMDCHKLVGKKPTMEKKRDCWSGETNTVHTIKKCATKSFVSHALKLFVLVMLASKVATRAYVKKDAEQPHKKRI